MFFKKTTKNIPVFLASSFIGYTLGSYTASSIGAEVYIHEAYAVKKAADKISPHDAVNVEIETFVKEIRKVALQILVESFVHPFRYIFSSQFHNRLVKTDQELTASEK